jgi:hypothetical protein
MLSLEEIQEKLKDRKLKTVAEKTGLHYDTVRRLAYGYFKSPSYEAVKILSDYLESK